MNKSELITWLATLPDDSPDLARVGEIRCGLSRDKSEGLHSLKELGADPEVRLHPTFLWKLGIKSVSENFGGRPRYRLPRVLEYLKSPECAAVREELRRKRRAGEQNKKPGADCPIPAEIK